MILSFGCCCTSAGELRHINIPVDPVNSSSTVVVNADVPIVEDIIWEWSGRGYVEIIKTANLLERNFRTARVHCDKRKELDVSEAGNSFLTAILSLKDEA